MALVLGLDLGSVSIKWAVAAPLREEESFHALLAGDSGFEPVSSALTQPLGLLLAVSRYQRVLGNPALCLHESLASFRRAVPRSAIAAIRYTGSGSALASAIEGASAENEFTAIARGVSRLYPSVRTILEIGGESSKYLRLESPNGNPRHTAITDYSTSGECAAGTGSFLDQQASRLLYQVEQIGGVVNEARRAAQIAGRCSVFAKSDMIHAQQRGYSAGEVLKGLCDAVARNFKSGIVKGKPVIPQAALIGAVSQNTGVVQALREALRLAPDELLVPELYAWFGAIGCALRAAEETCRPRASRASPSSGISPDAASPPASAGLPPLSLENVLLLRDRPQPALEDLLPARNREKIPAWMGIDVGSVSTNLAVLDEQGRLLHQIYLRTSGRPIEVVGEGLRDIQALLGDRIEICGVGTTGSGRELIGELVGADTVNDEITAHKTGAVFVHNRLVRRCSSGALSPESADGAVDTIFEIGGQDSKFISLDRGVVVDFAMNEACAAGTGSFLEEQAERMGISIQGEFAKLALASRAPARLGERCTVFMERDLISCLQRGARLEDLSAGLAYSIALNYLHRVVRNRKIGKVIYFQGGTAYNDAVAAAFSIILRRRIIVPPHNGVIGAIGMALIAREFSRERPAPLALAAVAGGSAPVFAGERSFPSSSFRGYDLNRASYEVREFTCKACSNFCEMKQIRVDGRKTYWGDKCSGKFRKPVRSCRLPVIEDLLDFRDRLLLGDPSGSLSGTGSSSLPRIGIPRAMYFYDRFPFWRRYLQDLGFPVVLSRPIERQGSDFTVAEPCFPVQIAHAHVHALFHGSGGEPPADFVLLPNVLDHESPDSSVASYLCPWNQTLPFVIRAAPAFAPLSSRILAPTLYFRLGPAHVKEQLGAAFARFGVRRKASDAAVDAAYAEQASFTARLLEAGRSTLQTLDRTAEPAVLLVGRPYNLYDRNGNCDIPRKLRTLYGVNVLPMDFLPLDETPVRDFHPRMFWNSGRRILAAGLHARRNPRLHLICITNFKCGPDSFLKHFLREAAGSPYLVLQFDGHGNDAGYLTRCEAFLDSKGALRCPPPS